MTVHGSQMRNPVTCSCQLSTVHCERLFLLTTVNHELWTVNGFIREASWNTTSRISDWRIRVCLGSSGRGADAGPALIEERFAKEKPLKGMRVSACLHVTAETANLCPRPEGRRGRGPLLRQQPAQHAGRRGRLAGQGTSGSRSSPSRARTRRPITGTSRRRLDHKPQLTMDDGADTSSRPARRAKGPPRRTSSRGTEETTTGVIRLRSMAKDGVLTYPDHRRQRRRHQALLRQPLRHRPEHDGRDHPGDEPAPGRQTVRGLRLRLVRARAWRCGRGGMGANVIVTEIDPLKALEAVMDGYPVMPMDEAARIGDIFVTVTGNMHVISGRALPAMKDGAMVCNSGHFNVEIDLERWRACQRTKRIVREFVEEYGCTTAADQRARRGPPDQSGRGRRPSRQRHGHELCQPGALGGIRGEAAGQAGEESLPGARGDRHGDCGVKLASMGVRIDKLTPEQRRYLESWSMGT